MTILQNELIFEDHMTLTSENKGIISNITKDFPKKESALLPVLFYIQDEYNYLDEMIMWELSELLMIEYDYIKEIADYNVMLRTHPVGEKIVRVCTNVSCTLKGGEELLEYLINKLGIKVGETTADKKHSLFTAHCLAHCNHSPAVQINDQYHEYVTLENIDEIL